jgi:hypothetical protein
LSSGYLFDKAELEREVSPRLEADSYVHTSMYKSWMDINPSFFPIANYGLQTLADRHLLVQLAVKNNHDRMRHDGFLLRPGSGWARSPCPFWPTATRCWRGAMTSSGMSS